MEQTSRRPARIGLPNRMAPIEGTCLMRLPPRWIMTLLAALALWPTYAAAADNLAEVITKPALTREDETLIDQEVRNRAGRLLAAASNSPADRAEARAALIDTARTSGATPAALEQYVSSANEYLTRVINGEAQAAAVDAALVLRQLKHVGAAPGLIAGLQTGQSGVQYHCAIGIRDLQTQIAADRNLSNDALRALADAGVATNNAALLRAIYEAVNFAATNPNFAQADAQAQALKRIFEARLERLELGSRDEMKDRAGYDAALAAARAGASLQAKRDLLRALVAFLGVHADRFGDRETAEAYLPTMRGLVEQLERAIAGILATENTSPPGRPLSQVIREKPSRSTAQAAREAVKSIRDGLKAAPWNLT